MRRSSWEEYERQARRRAIRDAIILWSMAIFAVIGVVATIAFLIVYFG
jgi:cell division septal protein FtsQ